MASSDDFPNMELGPSDGNGPNRWRNRVADYLNRPASASPQQASQPQKAGAWSVGDRVLAPWEPQWLYAGTVGEVRGNTLFIRFDDGDSGWIPASAVRALEVREGDQVFSRHAGELYYFPATVESQNDNEYFLRFDDGPEEWVTVDMFRVPVASVAPPPMPGPPIPSFGEPTEHESPAEAGSAAAAPARHWQRGDRVLAPWGNDLLFPGTVAQVHRTGLYIQFDDGDQGWAAAAAVRPLNLDVGSAVFCRRPTGPSYHQGRILRKDGNKIYVRFEEGGAEWSTIKMVCVPAHWFPA